MKALPDVDHSLWRRLHHGLYSGWRRGSVVI